MVKSLEKINIAMASDDFYAILIAPLIKSIEENHKTDEELHFYIIDDGISKKNKQKIQNSIDSSVSNLHWYKSKEIIPADIKIPIDSTAFPFTTYLRLFAPYMLHDIEEKIIYMDVDMIVLEDISKLWHTDIGDKLFAAVQDHQKVVSCSWGGIPNYRELQISADTKYFNAGLLLVNTKLWKERKVANTVIKCMNDNMKHVNYADQYGLNTALYDQWYELDHNWNSFASFDYKTPYIIHFLDIKPIFKSYNSKEEYRKEFYKYLQLTAWRDFKPVGNYKRILRKVYNKAKKKLLK